MRLVSGRTLLDIAAVLASIEQVRAAIACGDGQADPAPAPTLDPDPLSFRAIAKGAHLVLCPFCGAGCLPAEREDRHHYRCTGCGKNGLLPPEERA